MEDAKQTRDFQASGQRESNLDSSDHALGAAIAECQQRIPSRNPRALRAALQDLLGSETLLSQPLRHLIDLPGFHQLKSEKSASVRETQSTALLQELAQFYQPHILNRITQVLHGYLGLWQPLTTTEGQTRAADFDSPQDNAFATVSVDTNPTQTADYFLNKGLADLQQGAYRQAIHWLSKGLSQEANHAEAYLQRGTAYLKLNDHGSAMNDFNNAARLQPSDSEIYLQRGSLHQLMGAPTQARLDWTKASELGNQQAKRLLKQQQDSPQPSSTGSNQQKSTTRTEDLFKRSTEALRAANYEEADHLLTLLLTEDPGHAAAYVERGKTRSALSRDGSAINDFDAAIRLAPNIAEGYAHRGILHAKQGNNQKAKKDLLTALRLGHPQAGEWLTQQQQRLTQSHLKAGIESANRGDYRQALSHFQAAIKIDDKNATIYLQAGLSIKALGQNQEAIAWLSQSISLNPRIRDAYLGRATARLAINKPDKAIADFTSAISINTDCAEAYFGRALAHKALDHIELARSDLLKASSLGFSDAADLLAQLPKPATKRTKAPTNNSATKIGPSSRSLRTLAIAIGCLASLWIAWEGLAHQNWRPIGAAIGFGIISSALKNKSSNK